MRILFLNNLLPFPLDNGGKIKTFNTLKALATNHKIDLLTFINKEEDRNYISELEGICEKIEVVKKTVVKNDSSSQFLKDYFYSIFSDKPYAMNKFYSSQMMKLIVEFQKNHEYDAIYVNHLSMMVYQRFFNTKVILDQQNVESLIFHRFIKDTKGLQKVAGQIEYLKLKHFEKRSLEKSDHIIALSEHDKDQFYYLLKNKEKDIDVIPIHVQANLIKEELMITKKPINILFMGTMTWYPNYSGIRWFIDNVFPILNKDQFNLYIVGGNPPNDIKEKGEMEDNITVTGYVDDIDEIIKRCQISIVPLFVGSGQRVKIIESFAKGIPVISTTIGAEGIKTLNNENILIADSKEDFIEKILMLSSDNSLYGRIVRNARHTYETNYSTESLAKKLNKLLIKVLNND